MKNSYEVDLMHECVLLRVEFDLFFSKFNKIRVDELRVLEDFETNFDSMKNFLQFYQFFGF